MQFDSNGHFNVMHTLNGDALKRNMAKKEICTWGATPRKDAPLLCEVYKQSEVLP